MAEKRMLSKRITESDAFLDMPLSTQALYMHINQNADDDGFLNNPKKIARMIGASEDDLKLLVAKKFLLLFESGVVVVKHWRINNNYDKSHHKPTFYQEELSLLRTKDNKSYTLVDSNETQLRLKRDSDETLDKIRLDKIREDKNRLEEGYGEEPNPDSSNNEKTEFSTSYAQSFAQPNDFEAKRQEALSKLTAHMKG